MNGLEAYVRIKAKIRRFLKMEENDDGLYRGTDQEVHGSADPASSGDQSTGAKLTSATPGTWVNSTTGGNPTYYPATIGTGLTISAQTAAYQQAIMMSNYAQQMQNVTYYPSSIQAYQGYGGILGGGYTVQTSTSTGITSMALAPSEAEQYKKLKSDGIKMGEIVAYRCWPIKNGFLWSTAAGRAWAPGEPMKAGENHLRDGLGVYAFKEMSLCIQEFGDGYDYTAFGTVHLWGEIVEHKLGYRAEYAAIRSIDFIKGRGKFPDPDAAVTMRALYKVNNNAS